MNPLIALQGKAFDPRGVEADVLQNQMRQQALQSGQFDMQQKQDSIARQNSIRNALMQLPENSTPEAVSNLLTRFGAPDQAGAYMKAIREGQKFQLEGQKEQRLAQGFSQDQALKSIKHLSQTFGALAADPTVSHAKVISAIVEAKRNNLLPPGIGAEQVAEIMDMDDAKLKQYIETMRMKGVDLEKQIEMRKVNFVQVDNGGTVDTQTQNPYTGEVRIAASKKKVATPDALLADGTKRDLSKAEIDAKAIEGKANREAQGNAKSGEEEARLRKEFEGLPEVKSYKQAYPAYAAIQDATKRNTPQADINIVYGIAKLYDPNSVVREGEYATVANSPNIPERVKGLIQYVSGGGRLTPKVKAEILAEAEGRITSYKAEVEKTKQGYMGIASRGGMNPENIFTPMGEVGYTKPSGDGKRPSLDSIFK